MEPTKKRRVPATLHSELTEYTSLLRSLRTNDALDVTKHLTNAPSFARMDDLAGIEAGSSSPIAGPSDLNHANNFDFADESDNGSSRKAKSRESSMPARARRDHWTRWPLLLNDVLPPKWTLDDEIAVIASQILKRRPTPVFPVSPEEIDGDEEIVQPRNLPLDEDDPDVPFFVPYLTRTIAQYLVTILSLLNAHTPARPASMQNRIEPLDWKAVIDVIVCSGIEEYSNPKVVENVVKRMETIYGPSSQLSNHNEDAYRAIKRMKRKADADDSFDRMIGSQIDQLFSMSKLRPPDSKDSKTQSKRSEQDADTGYRPRIKGQKRQRELQDTEAASPPQHGISVPTPRRSRREKPAVNYSILPT